MKSFTVFDRSTILRRVALTLEWKVEDFWVGAFWKLERRMSALQFDLWICLLPCLPIHFKLIKLKRPLPSLDEVCGIFNRP